MTEKFCLKCGSRGQGETCTVCAGPLVSQEDAPIIRLNLDRIIEGAPIFSAHRLLAGYAKSCHVKFEVHQNAIAAQTVFQPEFIMPVVSIEALRIWKSIHGASQEQCSLVTEADKSLVRFKKQPDSLFPLCAYSPDIGQDHGSLLRMLTLCLAARHVLGMVENSTINLSPYIAAWDKIDWAFSDRLPEVVMPAEFDGEFKQREFVNFRGARTQAVSSVNAESHDNDEMPLGSQITEALPRDSSRRDSMLTDARATIT